MPQSDSPGPALRTVRIPPQKYECSQCGKTERLSLCICRQLAYCSVACQRHHWKTIHKPSCTGKPDVIDLVSINPLFAMLVESCHLDAAKPIHPALNHTITNSPNPSIVADTLPNGAGNARLVVLGDSIPISYAQNCSEVWWPTASSAEVRYRLQHRIVREGYLLSILTALCVGVVSEIYTATNEGAASASGFPRRAMQLKYKTSPIVDFGIVKGKVEVLDHQKLAYYLDGDVIKGQDPNDHYWLYFTTFKGEEVFLDYGASTFTFTMNVETKDYRQPILPPVNYAPAYLRGRQHTQYTLNLYEPLRRFSFLRDDVLRPLVAQCVVRPPNPSSLLAICKIVDRLAGRDCTSTEKMLANQWATYHCHALRLILGDPQRSWTKWPETPRSSFQFGPEFDSGSWPADSDTAAWRLEKLNQRYNRGEITKAAYAIERQAWSRARRPSDRNL